MLSQVVEQLINCHVHGRIHVGADSSQHPADLEYQTVGRIRCRCYYRYRHYRVAKHGVSGGHHHVRRDLGIRGQDYASALCHQVPLVSERSLELDEIVPLFLNDSHDVRQLEFDQRLSQPHDFDDIEEVVCAVGQWDDLEG